MSTRQAVPDCPPTVAWAYREARAQLARCAGVVAWVGAAAEPEARAAPGPVQRARCLPLEHRHERVSRYEYTWGGRTGSCFLDGGWHEMHSTAAVGTYGE